MAQGIVAHVAAPVGAGNCGGYYGGHYDSRPVGN